MTTGDDGRWLVGDARAAGELAAMLIRSSMESTHQLTDDLMRSYRRDAIRAEARLQAARGAVVTLLSGPWLPSADAIIRAMYPSEDAVMRCIPSYIDTSDWEL